jgi:uncharacterized membrane protein YhaH (DUF805 family)
MGLFSYLDMIVVFALVLPTVAVWVRRLHDLDRAGWWALLSLTGIGAIVLLVWASERGTQGPNPFGPGLTPR